ncbi:MAG TPA: hypothetical protein VMF62_14955 [Acetobacteraceae bacterium]|nr:hypothetical protein [Acetobacteraceae bacterium]
MTTVTFRQGSNVVATGALTSRGGGPPKPYIVVSGVSPDVRRAGTRFDVQIDGGPTYNGRVAMRDENGVVTFLALSVS